MADVKISQLTALASASTDVAGDVLAIVDTSVPQTKKITVENLVAPITLDKSNARVGIGQSSPTTTLDVNGAVNMSSTLALGGDLTISNSIPLIYMNDTSGNDNNQIIFQAGGSNIFRIGTDITTNNGTSNFEMTNGDGNASRLTIESDGTIVTSGAFQPGGNVTVGGNLALSATNTLYFDGNSGHTFISEYSANKMQLQAGGQGSVILDGTNSGEIRMGVGTSSPAATLHTAHSSSTAYNGAAEILESVIIQNTNGSDGSGVNNVASLGLQVASGATSQGFINYVRTGDNTGKFTISQRNGSSTYAETFVVNSNADPVYITQYGLGINCNNPGERSTSGTSQQYISVDGASNGAVVELVTSQNGDDYFMGAIDWVNAANGVSNANNAAGRLTAAIRAYTDTDDSNASDDSGAHMLFYTKPSAGSLTLRWSFNAEGYSTPYGSIIPAANNSYNLGSTTYRWSVLYSSNAVNVSDETLKTDIQDCDLGIDFINTLKPKSFKMKDLEKEHDDYDKKHYGLIAQDLKDGKFKDSVYGDKDGDYGLAYNDLIAPLIKAVQELSAKVETLENA